MDQEALNVYCGCKPIVDTEYTPETDRSPAELIVEALAEATGVDPLDLPPLYEFVDPDALNQLFKGHDGASNTEALRCFRVETWNVFVRADGHIRVCDNTQLITSEPVFESTHA